MQSVYRLKQYPPLEIQFTKSSPFMPQRRSDEGGTTKLSLILFKITQWGIAFSFSCRYLSEILKRFYSGSFIL
jgi:hypothetical protein